MINKFLVLLITTTILLVSLVSAIEPSSTIIQISIKNNTLQITGEDIINTNYNFTYGYCSNLTNTSSIDDTRSITLFFINKNISENELSCFNQLSQANNKWTQCYSDNMNISVANALCQQDVGYKDNFTVCQTDLVNKNAQLIAKDTEKASIQKQFDDEKSGTTQKYGLGALAGVVACYLFLRYKGKTAPVKFGSENFPQAPSNLV